MTSPTEFYHVIQITLIYLNGTNFCVDKCSRFLRIFLKFPKLNPCEIFDNCQFKKINPRENFGNGKFVKINPREIFLKNFFLLIFFFLPSFFRQKIIKMFQVDKKNV